MKNTKDKSLKWSTSEGLHLFTDLIKENKIILGPSDTVLGLYGQPSPEAVLSLNELKNRCKKPYLLMIRDQKVAEDYAQSGQFEKYQKLLDVYWPGPLTVIVKARPDLPIWAMSEQKTVALRIPNHPLLNEILTMVPALFSTSANLAGGPVPTKIDQVEQSIVEGVDAIVFEDGAEQPSVPSTIIDISSGQLVIIREGAISTLELMKHLR